MALKDLASSIALTDIKVGRLFGERELILEHDRKKTNVITIRRGEHLEGPLSDMHVVPDITRSVYVIRHDGFKVLSVINRGYELVSNEDPYNNLLKEAGL